MDKNFKNIDIVVPVFNEQQNLEPLVGRIESTLLKTFLNIHIIFVDDGSDDDTENTILELKKNESITISYIKLSLKHGKDLAIKCGIDHSKAALCSIIDGDLQHPPEKINEALEKIKQGFNIVHIEKIEYAGSKLRESGSFLFRNIINFLSGRKIHLSDFKLLDNKAISFVKNFKELNYFNRGIVDVIGLEATEIMYEPNERHYGESKYSFIKLLSLALNSVISISTKPLRLSIYFGFFIAFLSFIYGIYILFVKIYCGQPIPGFTTLGIAVFFLGGIQLVFLGILGEYIGKIFIESKRRPQYIIDSVTEL